MELRIWVAIKCEKKFTFKNPFHFADAQTRSEFCTINPKEPINNVSALLALLSADTPELREATAETISVFASDSYAAEQLAAGGALILIQKAASKQPNSVFIRQAFEKLLEHNLSVKYASKSSN